MLGHVCQETTRRVLGYALTSMKPLIRKQKQRQKSYYHNVCVANYFTNFSDLVLAICGKKTVKVINKSISINCIV